MSDIARLTVALYANSAQFVSDLEKSKGKAKDWSGQVGGYFSTVAKTAGVMATAAVGSLVLIYNQQAQMIDQNAKLADSLGMTMEGYTRLKYAADLTGAGEAFTGAMESMVVKMGEAQFGGGEAKEALDMLGLSAQKLGKLTPEKQLLSLSDALLKVENQSQRTFLTDQLFGGPEMVGLLSQGADGINKLTAEADALGVTLTRVDAAKVEMANDAMYKLGVGTTALKQQLTTELAPVVAAMADEFREYTAAHGGMNNMIAQGMEYGAKTVGFMADSLHGLNLIIKGVNVGVKAIEYAFISIAQPVSDAMYSVGQTIFKVITQPLLTALQIAGAFDDDIAAMAVRLESFGNMPAPQLFDNVDALNAKMELSDAIWQLQSLAAEPLPSAGIEDWFKNAKSRIQEAAELYASSINRNDKGKGGGVEAGKNPDVIAYQEGTASLQQELQRRLAIQAAGDSKAAVQESFVYQDRYVKLSASFQKAYEAATNNQALQAELEDQYFSDREALYQIHQANLTDIEAEQLALRQEQNQGFWETYLESLEGHMLNMDELTGNMLNNFTTGFGNAFESMIFDSESLGDAFKNMMVGLSRSVVNSLGQMAGQWLAYQAVQMIVGKTTAAAGAMGLASNAAAMSIQAGINAFASTAAIPIVGPAMAPAAMGAAVAVTGPMAASVAALAAAGVAGQAHSGISNVPNEGTWLLDKGERVYTNESANQLDQMYGKIMGGNGGNASGQSNVTVNLYEDASRAGQVEQNQGLTGEDVINIFVSNIRQGGEIASTQEKTYNLQRAGF